jgi:hypothetical protein
VDRKTAHRSRRLEEATLRRRMRDLAGERRRFGYAIPDTSILGKRLARELDALVARCGRPQLIVSAAAPS